MSGQAVRPVQCPACQARQDAASSAAGRLLEILQASPGASAGAHAPGMCLRHVMSLRQQDTRNADAAVRVAACRAEYLVRELEEAFRKRAPAHRSEPRCRQITAWRRAATLSTAESTAATPLAHCEIRRPTRTGSGEARRLRMTGPHVGFQNSASGLDLWLLHVWGARTRVRVVTCDFSLIYAGSFVLVNPARYWGARRGRHRRARR
jgi:hypothetical protein